jgi:hypothetical protein
VRYGLPVALLAAVLMMSGCSDDKPPTPPAASPSETPDPTYDASLEPSAAVLALVPETAQTLTVTDFDQVKLELGLPDVADDSDPAALQEFWNRAVAERPLLTPGMLRPDEQQLRTTYGFSQIDVEWEAHFFDSADQEAGWVLAFRDATDMQTVQKAVDDGIGQLAGATVDAQQHLVSSGITSDPTQSWAADEETVAMVGLPANATYVARGCTQSTGGETAAAGVDELDGWSVQFEGSLVTARLGEARHDLFTRLRLGSDQPSFVSAYDGGVADPPTGRIGYMMADPAAAARLALEHRLPFATCA